MECASAFNYARTLHHPSIILDDSIPNTQTKTLFHTDALSLDLRFVAESSLQSTLAPAMQFERLDLRNQSQLGESAYCDLTLEDGQAVTFMLRQPPGKKASSHAQPSVAQANALGVLIESTCLVVLHWYGAADRIISRFDSWGL